MTKDYKQKYKTTNWPEYNKALTNRGNLTIWFDSKMQWQAPLKGKRGKPQGLCCINMLRNTEAPSPFI